MRDKRIVPYRLQLKDRSRTLRRDSTSAEKKLWFEFLRQKPLGAYVADFYCSRFRLVIEIDGDSRFSDTAEMRDAERTASLAALNLTVLRFSNDDVMERFEGVCMRIEQALVEKS